MTARVLDSLASTDALSALFDDAAILGAMLAFEGGLARVQARLGVIPESAARSITAATASAEGLDRRALVRGARASGTLAIPLVEALVARVGAADEPSARFVHFGATSQDAVDTALVLTLSRARDAIALDQARLAHALRALSDRHAETVMLGRTLLQPASPITFGLKVAGWFGAVRRTWSGLAAAFDGAHVIQLGGAAGTLAAFGEHGPAIGRALATELGLAVPDAPWHTHRDRIGAVVTACGLYVAALGKIARDVSLLMQHEVGEVAERGGGSSTMPHKRNPSGCAIVIAAATRAPGLVATYLSGELQEHERSAGGWHAEWPTVAAIVEATGAATAATAGVIEGLTVFPDRMRDNLDRTSGVIFAERVRLALARLDGPDTANRLVAEALERTHTTGRRFGDVVRETPALARAFSPDDLARFDEPERYLGAAHELRRALLVDTPDSHAPNHAR